MLHFTDKLPVGPPEGWCSLCKLGDAPHIISNCLPARSAKTGKILTNTQAKKVRYLLVGEAPGEQENNRGIPFIGPAGKILDRILKALTKDGLELEEVAITNSVRCQPEANKNPPIAAKRACLGYLNQEVDLLQPELIVAMGGQALSAIKNKVSGISVAASRMKTLHYETPEGTSIPLMVTYHPAAILYDKTKLSALLDDLHSILIEKIWQDREESQIDCWLVNSEDEWEILLRKLKKEKRISLDIESRGLSATIVSIGFCFPDSEPDQAYVVPVYHRQAQLQGKTVLKEVRNVILKGKKLVIGQNIDFDLSRLARASGGPVTFQCLADDSMVFHALLDENAETRKLGYLATKYAGEGDYKEDINIERIDTEPLNKITEYNGRDAAVPPMIIKAITRRLKEFGYYSPQMVRLYRRHSIFAAAIEASGMKVDTKRLNEVGVEQQIIIRKLEKKVAKEAPGINLDSPSQLSAYIFGENSGLSEDKIPDDSLHLPVPNVKDSIGARHASTNANILGYVDHPFVRTLLDFRGAAKIYRTYVQGTRKSLHPNKFVYPDVLVIKTERGGTVSGRWAVKDPALQTFPYTSLRSCFVSRYGGDGVLLDIDGSQMELRWAAHASQDATLQEVFGSGEDPHQATADLCGVERPVGKMVNFAAIYGVSVRGLMIQAGISKSLAQNVVSSLKNAWASLYEYQEEATRLLIRNGEVSTPYGRWRRLPGATMATPRGRFLVREGVNFLYQAAAHDLTQLLGWQMMRDLDGLALPVMSNHDGLTWDLRKKDLSRALDKIHRTVVKFPRLVENIMKVSLSIPFEFDVKAGENWLEQEDLTTFSTGG